MNTAYGTRDSKPIWKEPTSVKATKSILSALTVGAFALAAAPSSHAVPTLELTSGGSTVTVGDQTGSDLNPILGAVTFLGSVGAFSVNISAGESKPLLGSATQPFMDFGSIDFSSSAGGTLTLLFSDTNFSGPINLAAFAAAIRGTVNTAGANSLTFTTWADPNNTLFGMTDQLTNQPSFGPGAFSGSALSSFNLDLSGPYSLTEKLVITHVGAGTTSFDATLHDPPLASVPDGGSAVALLGLALVGIEGMRRKFMAA